MNKMLIPIIAVVAVAAVAIAAIAFMNGGDKGPAPIDEGKHDSGLVVIDDDTSSDSIAVIYFSVTGGTESVAKKIADITGGDLIQIIPAVPYTEADRVYYDDDSRCSIERYDPSARPAIANDIDISGYSVIYLGYPIWYGDSPKIMWTFVEEHDLSGKTIVPFCTSGSSGIGNSDDSLKALTDEGTWMNGKRFAASASASELKDWISNFGLGASA